MTTRIDPYVLPLKLELPIPRSIERGSGITATSGPNACLIQYRGIEAERDRLQYAARLLGITNAVFMRSLVNDAADVIIRLHEASLAVSPSVDVVE